MHITLRPGEKLYLNGAVFRVDRKVSLELMNDATFLLETHIMHPDRATTPIRQLYFVVQMMLMNPLDTVDARHLFEDSAARMKSTYRDRTILEVLAQTERHVASERYFEALKGLRGFFDRDDALMSAAGLRQLAEAS